VLVGIGFGWRASLRRRRGDGPKGPRARPFGYTRRATGADGAARSRDPRGLAEATSNNRTPAGFTDGGRRSVDAGCAWHSLPGQRHSTRRGQTERRRKAVRVPTAPTERRAPGIRAASPRPPPTTGHPQGSPMEGVAPSTPVARGILFPVKGILRVEDKQTGAGKRCASPRRRRSGALHRIKPAASTAPHALISDRSSFTLHVSHV
jgi:hypothetical protein